LRRNGGRDKVLHSVFLQPTISDHSPPSVPRSRKVDCL
jgi:hypothetical protein